MNTNFRLGGEGLNVIDLGYFVHPHFEEII